MHEVLNVFEKLEGKIMKELDHCNICKFIEGYESFSKVYFIMELCNGGSLLDRFGEVPDVDEETVRHIIDQVLYALEYVTFAIN